MEGVRNPDASHLPYSKRRLTPEHQNRWEQARSHTRNTDSEQYGTKVIYITRPKDPNTMPLVPMKLRCSIIPPFQPRVPFMYPSVLRRPPAYSRGALNTSQYIPNQIDNAHLTCPLHPPYPPLPLSPARSAARLALILLSCD